LQTKAIFFAYLFGVLYDISEIVPFAKERGLDIIEDCAQSFNGPQNFNGSPGATLTMFSFGTIKVQTAIYGGIGIVRNDDDLFNTMKVIQDNYPMFTPKMWRKRIYVVMALYYFINTQRGNRIFDYAARLSK
jgi:dTDP-4-amino-4,6-dideoxygalactose transaminase